MALARMSAFVGRYGLAGAGPIFVAVSQFALSILILHGVSAREFGIAALLLLVSQLGLSISSAMLCAPFQVASLDTRRYGRAFYAVDVALAAAVAIACWSVGMMLGASVLEVTIFAVCAALQTLRWFARAEAYAQGAVAKVIASDLCYGLPLLSAIAAMALLGVPSLAFAFGALAICGLIALLPFGMDFIPRRLSSFSFASLADYRPIWNQHSRWSLTGVVTTEATVNAHAYLVTILLGPSAFAPVAAASLLIRPVGLAMNALSDFDRPRLAKLLEASESARARGLMAELSVALLLAWCINVVACIIILQWWPQAVVPQGYDLASFTIGASLWLAVALVRISRSAASVAMQASGDFRNLAFATYLSCIVSTVGVLVAVLAWDATWSVLGILAGEFVVTWLVLRASATSLRRLIMAVPL